MSAIFINFVKKFQQMLHATFRISGSELTTDFLEKIKSLFIGDSKDFDVIISVKPKESPEAQKLRIDRSIENIERRENLVAFSSEEYDSLVRQLSRQ